MRNARIGFLSASLAFPLCLLLALLETQAVTLVSTTPHSVTAMGDSTSPVFSADGRFLVFESTAGNLVTNDLNHGLLDVFVRDVAGGTIHLVSINSAGVSGNGRSYAPSMSADGMVVAFASQAGDLVANDTNNAADVFVRNFKTGQTQLVSRSTNGASANADSGSPILTPDGHFVVFESRASDLAPGSTPGRMNVYRSDLTTGETILISEAQSDVTTAAASDATSPAVSDDGGLVLFLSNSLLVTTTNGFRHNLYLRDVARAETRVIPLFNPPPSSLALSLRPSMNSNGTVAAVSTMVSGTGGVYRVALPSGTAELIAPELNTLFLTRRPSMTGPILSRDGRLIYFQGISNTVAELPEAVYAWDVNTGKSILISTNTVTVAGSPDPQPFGEFVAASPDGRFVAWLSYARPGASHPSSEPIQLFVQDRDSSETRRVIHRADGSFPLTPADFPAVSFSADGLWVAFQSAASDLVAGDYNDANDVFLYNWTSDQLELVSRSAETQPSKTGTGFPLVRDNCLSADGHWLVYVSSGAGLVPGATGNTPNVFLRDLVTGSNRLVSVSLDGTGVANGSCREPSISADGRWVTFTSFASNLVNIDTNNVDDVFLCDLGVNTTFLVSHAANGRSGNGPSSGSSLSADGSRVAFVSTASDLVAGDSNQAQDVLVYERTDQSIHLISAAPNGSVGQRASYRVMLSPDSRWVVFESTAPNLVVPPAGNSPNLYAWHEGEASVRRLTTDSIAALSLFPIVFSPDSSTVTFAGRMLGTTSVYAHEFAANRTASVFPGATAWSLSSDGSRLAYLGAAPRQPSQVVLFDRLTGQTNVVSLSSENSAQANDRCASPLLTPDDRFVVFGSLASNLVPNDTNNTGDLFLRDLTEGTTILLTQSLVDTVPGDRFSGAPILGADGRTLVFRSFASNLAAHDFNEHGDLFVLRLPGAESSFRISTLYRVATGEVTLLWAAHAGASYRLEYTETLPANWKSLDTEVTTANGQASAVDRAVSGPAARFYRVIENLAAAAP